MMSCPGLGTCPRRLHCLLQSLAHHYRNYHHHQLYIKQPKLSVSQAHRQRVAYHHRAFHFQSSTMIDNNTECIHHRMHRPKHKRYLRREQGMSIHQSCLPHLRKSYSQPVTEEEVTFDNIFSEVNRRRVALLLDTVKPARTMEMMGMKREGAKVSAVLVPLCVVNGEPSVLFTLRSSSLRSHRGEVSFPGGNQDDSDPDYVHTALRETFEEIGLNPRYFDVWGNLTPTPSSRKTSIAYPVLARYTKDLDLSSLDINRDEVEEVFTCSIRELCGERDKDGGGKVKVGSTQFRSGPGYTLPVYRGTPHRIWGLSAIFLHQVLTLLAPRLYTFKLRHIA